MYCPFINYEKKIGNMLIRKGKTLSCAESCTGGLISSLLTDVSGSSAYIKSNFVTYTNEAKEKYLSVRQNYSLEVEQMGRCIREGETPHVTKDFTLSNLRTLERILKAIE